MQLSVGSVAPFGGTAETVRTRARREEILLAAMEAFATRGFHDANVGEIARRIGVAKGSIFHYFGTKEGLFFAAYVRAVRSLPTYLDVPPEVIEEGFFATLHYWLEATEGLLLHNWNAMRVTHMGSRSDEPLRTEIERFLAGDPFGTRAFIRFGQQRGEVRDDIDEDLLVSMIDWMVRSFEDVMLFEGWGSNGSSRSGRGPKMRARRVQQFEFLIYGAMGVH